jgi:hypothetical protein
MLFYKLNNKFVLIEYHKWCMILQPRLSLLFGESFSGTCIGTMINNQIQQLKKRTWPKISYDGIFCFHLRNMHKTWRYGSIQSIWKIIAEKKEIKKLKMKSEHKMKSTDKRSIGRRPWSGKLLTQASTSALRLVFYI